MGNFNKKWRFTIAILLVALLVYYLYRHGESLGSLKNLSVSSLTLLFTSRLLMLLGNGYLLKVSAQKFSVFLHPKEWAGMAFITGLGNYIGPLSFGMIIRAAYLKKKHNFPFSHFISVLGATYLIHFFALGILGLMAAGWLYYTSLLSWKLSFIFACFVLCLLGLILLPWQPPAHQSTSKLIRKICQVLEGWQFIRRDSGLLLKITAIALFNIFLNGLSFWIAYVGLGIEVTIAQAFLISSIGVFSLLINITPANLGIQELAIGLSSEYILIDGGPDGLLAALTLRATSMVLVFTLGPLFSLILTQDSSDQTPSNEESLQ